MGYEFLFTCLFVVTEQTFPFALVIINQILDCCLFGYEMAYEMLTRNLVSYYVWWLRERGAYMGDVIENFESLALVGLESFPPLIFYRIVISATRLLLWW